MQAVRWIALTVLLFAGAPGGAADPTAVPSPWRSVADDVYLQEVGRKIPTSSSLRAVAVHQGKVYAGSQESLLRLVGDQLLAVEGVAGPVDRLIVAGGALWALTPRGPFRLRETGWERHGEAAVTDLSSFRGDIYGAVGSRLLRLEAGQWRAVGGGEAPGAILRLATHADSVYALLPGRLAVFEGDRFNTIDVADWGELPSSRARDLLAIGGRLYIATDRGLGLLRGMALKRIGGEQGLCYEDTTCLAAGFESDFWIGTTEGAIRAVEGAFQYFAADRWLPSNRVHQIAVADRAAYVATDGGLGVIEYEPYTLLKKADYYERHLEAWGQKRLGFTHQIQREDERSEWLREVSDNDGGWSAEYLAAMSFKFAVTGDPAAYAEAVDTFEALKWTEEITPIPGFPARAIWAVGETGVKSMGTSGCCPAEWHPTPDGLWEWKADTSSDEVDAQVYGVAIFHDFAAQGRDKARAAEHLGRIGAHIIDNGWVLRDMDGLPTKWGRWDPEYLQRPVGYYARGLNGMEAMAYMRAARALTGEARFDRAHDQLLAMRYHREALRQKLVFPPDDVNHSDDRMAFFIYFTLLRYEPDPWLASLHRRGLERSFEIERIERNPFFNVTYAALTGAEAEIEAAVEHLREWPLDLIDHSYRNSHRHDLRPRAGHTAYAGGSVVLSPRERGPMRWSHNPFHLDGGSGGRKVFDPSAWLNAYWKARYYGLIQAPAVEDPSLRSAPPISGNPGARPYDGPPRPSAEARARQKAALGR